MPTAGILVIGNEILSGKVVDSNSPYLCKQLRALGVDVEQITTIPDVIETIASEVREMSRRFDYVITSGGVGPTHDDVTMDGIAAAFERPIESNPVIETRLRECSKGELNESQLKMAKVPAGAAFIDSDHLWIPLVVVENVYIFPGIPELLQKKFEGVRDRFSGVPYVLRRIYVNQFEHEIADALNDLLEEFPKLMLGSYPKIREENFKVLLTLESRDADYAQRALDSLLGRLLPSAVHKAE
jgi:molybdenum cofactor synthesis domain-containing protein